MISEPYNFQHLTHTGPVQAKTLKTANPRELVTEFSAIRASQAPQRALKGIKAEDISTNFSPATSSFTSPIMSLESPVESRPTSPFGSPTSGGEGRSLHHSKSIDSFTRISTKSFSSPKPPVSPPPRRSSRQVVGKSHRLALSPPPVAFESPIVLDASTPISATSSPSSYFNLKQSSFSPIGSGAVEEGSTLVPSEIAQAVTTPDDSAYLFISQARSGSNLGLADVPEEEEDGHKHVTKQSAKPHTLRHAKSFPSSRSFVSPATQRLPWSTPQPDGEGWGARPDPTLPSPRQSQQIDDIPMQQTERTSISPHAGHSSWEEDIDYCYEHAMEAEGSDWDQSSADDNIWMNDTTNSSTPTPALNGRDSPPTNLYLNNFPPFPEESSSATSSSVSVPGLVTPSEPSSSRSNPILYPLSPSLLVPKEYASRVTHEESYTQNLHTPEPETGKHIQSSFPYYPADLRLDTDFRRGYNSPRSSGSPISKTTSRESLATGKSSAAASKHRRSSSVGSVPELVPSSHTNGRANAYSIAESDHFPIQLTESHEPDMLSVPTQIRHHAPHPPATAPPVPFPAPIAALPSAPSPTFAARARANSEATRPALPDLALIGAPRTHSRLRSGSVAATVSKPRGHRTSYSLFPQGSMSNMREAAGAGPGRPF